MPNRAVIKVIQNRDFLTSTPEKSARAVASHMKSLKLGAVLVVSPDDGKLLGICTERDLVHKILAPGLDVNTTPVSAIMTPNPQTISPDKPFGHALHLMFEGGYRHMPVIAPNGLPIGVLSARDALGLEVFNFANELVQRETLAEVL
ncbi:MAG: CBS domain-containing protein [Azonexus sp.]|jgi:CBS domain-containing protein|nr:CBS domain-containing protein [Azonexus sp.]